MLSNFILNFTPTGMIPTKEMTPNVPVSPEEIANEVLEAAELGANMVHLHARDGEEDKPTYQKEIYAETISNIRKYDKQIVLCVSTSGRDFPDFERRSQVLDLSGDVKPDFGSLTLSSLNFNAQASINSPDTIKGLAQKMLDNDIRPELEAFDIGMINYSRYLAKKGLLKPPYYYNLILGNIACAQANMLNMGLMVNELPEDSMWSAGGIGNYQLPMNAMSLVAGGGVRVGLEDNIWFDKERTTLATNTDLIKRVLSIGKELGLAPYQSSEVREMFGLNG